jgi:hypothetical protein
MNHRTGDRMLSTRPRRLSPSALLLWLAACALPAAATATSAMEASRLATDIALAQGWTSRALAGDAFAFGLASEHCDAVSAGKARLEDRLRDAAGTPSAERAQSRWQGMTRRDLDTWLEGCAALARSGEALLSVHQAAGLIDGNLQPLLSLIDSAATRLASEGASGVDVYIVTRQLVLLERMRAASRKLASGDELADLTAGRLARDQQAFVQTMTLLIEGDAESRKPVEDVAAREALQVAAAQFQVIEPALRVIVTTAPGLATTREALKEQFTLGLNVIRDLRELSGQPAPAR